MVIPPITPSTVAIPHGRLLLLPILHGRLECALLVRQAFAHHRPDAVAVELPPTLEAAVLRAVARLPLLSVVHYQESSGQTVYWPIEPTDPLVEAVRLALAEDVPLSFIDRDLEGYPRIREAFPDPYTLNSIGLPAYAEAYRQTVAGLPTPEPDRLREQAMAYHLQRLAKRHERVLTVFGLAHYPGLLTQLAQPQAQPLARLKRPGVQVAHLAEEASREVLTEIPYVVAAYERWRQEPQAPALDRLAILRQLVATAVGRYQKATGGTITPRQLAILHQFARNYALVQGQLTPDFYQLVVAARGVADDDFAYEVWDVGATYPWQEAEPHLPVLRLTGADFCLHQKKIRFQRRLRQSRKRLLPIPVRRRPREQQPGLWRRLWQGESLCSYPPEDLVVEGFGGFVRQKAKNLLAEQNRRVQPFVASLLDGIDIRETIRHWPEGILYVTEQRRGAGNVGAVVVIFDPDEGAEEKFPWRLTWLGEHAQESDMALYATPPGEDLVGPGISRCQYGGFLLSYPPWRLYDIWQDPYFEVAATKAERLLLAALDYSLEKYVVYIAATPPRSRWLTIASRMGKKISYLPIGSFSPLTIKRLRVFHVLDGRPVRRWAGEYI
ncbi:MAG: hypothetical protein ACUVRZ_04050 [Desulfobacca sp.]|uniref:hypothetical protein n=1 Tax=Desulfobacca sp. TaxID=2067990 RepID=UPI0040496F0E